MVMMMLTLAMTVTVLFGAILVFAVHRKRNVKFNLKTFGASVVLETSDDVDDSANRLNKRSAH